MKSPVSRLALPLLLLLALLLLQLLWPGEPQHPWIQLTIWFTGTWSVVRLLHLAIWEGIVQHRTGVPAPPLLTALVDLLIWISTALIVLTDVFNLPVAGFATTSGVAFAFAGLASRNVLSDAAAGIGMTFDKAVGIGDWVEVRGHIGQVVRMSWRSTTLRRGNGLLVTLSNSQMAESTLIVYRAWRDEFDVDLDYSVPQEQAERILLAAAAEAVPPLDPPVPGRAPIVRMIAFTPAGVRWRLLYWVADFPTADSLRSTVERAVLRNLTIAGLRTAIPSQSMTIERRPPETGAATPVAGVIARMALFEGLTVEERARLAESSTMRAVPAGTFVVREGEEGQSMFVIREGLFDVVIGDSDWPVTRMAAGDFFGEMSLLTGAPRAASVRAASDAVIVEIGRDALMPLVAEREVLAERLGAALLERMDRNLAATEAQRAISDSLAAKAARSRQMLSAIRHFFGVGNKSGL